jgi:outer membrane lipoprotein
MMRLILLSILAVLLVGVGCASVEPQSPTDGRTPTPRQVAALGIPKNSRKAHWGGVIVNIRNMRKNTEFEVISYPLNRNDRPDTDEAPQGRFIAIKAGYLEPLNYAPGRRITLEGSIETRRLGSVGAAKYLFPVVQVETIRLWPKGRTSPSPVFNFGFGVGSGGRASGGVGVGVGF